MAAGVDFENSESSNALDILTLDCGDLLFGTNISDPFGDIASVAAATINPTAAADNYNITNLTTTTNNNNIDSRPSGDIPPTSSTSNLQTSPPPSLDPFNALFPFPFPGRHSDPYPHSEQQELHMSSWATHLSSNWRFPPPRSFAPQQHHQQQQQPQRQHREQSSARTPSPLAPPNIQQPRGIFAATLRHQSQDTSSVFYLPRPSTTQPTDQGIDDPYVAALATGDFSSPSLPPLSSSPLPPPSRHRSSLLPKPLEIGETMPPALRRSSRGSRGGGGVVDLTKEEPDFDNMNSGIDPTTPMAPRARKRHAATFITSDDTKRRRTSQSSSRLANTRKNTLPRYDASSPLEDFDSPQKTDDEDPDSIDLSNVDEVPTELMAPRVDNRVKLGKFQCVICMDDVTALTVTHCGETAGESILRVWLVPHT
ncbi:hypothetical protein DL768_006520 [Monosporascus sp. mg162]|nr:hypothetical protein DL768_006520 [Monosporascus sp. mg162]